MHYFFAVLRTIWCFYTTEKILGLSQKTPKKLQLKKFVKNKNDKFVNSKNAFPVSSEWD